MHIKNKYKAATSHFVKCKSLILVYANEKETIIFWDFPLPPLEVKELNAIGKDKQEEEDPTNMSQGNRSQEIIFKAWSLLKIQLHWLHTCSRYLNRILLVAHLRCHQSVDGPSNRGSPVVPPPPYRYLLQMYSLLEFNILLQKHTQILRRHTHHPMDEKAREEIPKA